MKRSRLLWRIYLYFLVAALAALCIATGNAVHILRHSYEEWVAEELEMLARLSAGQLLRYSLAHDASQIDRMCKEVGSLTGTRMTVILPGGRVIGDSHRNPAFMDNHAGRPEIVEAFRGKTGRSVRYSDTLKKRLKYVAVPVRRNGVIVAVVRMSRPLAKIRWTQHVLSNELLIGGFFAAVLFALVALYLSRRITRPLEEMRRKAERLAKGDFSARMDLTADDEIGALARAIDEMAAQLSDRMDAIIREHVEKNAMLACMVEGVLAVDAEGRILYVNKALSRLLDIEPEQARGRSIQEAVRHHEVQEFVRATLRKDGPSEREVLVPGKEERHLQLHGAPLVHPDEGRIGGLVVVNDITRLKRLERVRSDFVANVSHELKTPITALKGCVETLSGDVPLTAEEIARFTAIMSRHVCRLEAIVEDLLRLSQIEFEAERGRIHRERTSLADVLRRVENAFTAAARAKRMTLNVKCPEDLSAVVNGPLLERAIGNLVDNAIKYSAEDTPVSIVAQQDGNQIVIQVTDQGPGIEKRHLSRIFERFYRVDPARSRALGGTGLGLSIVKHIVLAHGGNITVDSAIGRGTTFTLRLPKA